MQSERFDDNDFSGPFAPLLTREEGLRRLEEFLPRAGRAYARDRNHDRGPEQRSNVSGLSPYLRHRLITEQEVLSAVTARHSLASAEKFIQEVFWRTYWKGWLEARGALWEHYREQLGEHFAALSDNAANLGYYQAAVEGMTGVEPFDAWARELTQTNYLHNHARMWFASIWIFTLRLPWQLGADFFMQHLLDGDPASNTLSWRWVAGLQTRGKHYLARAENIERYSGGRFRSISGLHETADALEEDLSQAGADSEPLATVDLISEGDLLARLDRAGPGSIDWLLHEEDLHPEKLTGFLDSLRLGVVQRIGILEPVDGRSAFGSAAAVTAGVAQATTDLHERLTQHTAGTPVTLYRMAVEDLGTWLAGGAEPAAGSQSAAGLRRAAGARLTLTPLAPVGPVRRALSQHSTTGAGAPLLAVQRHYDAACWPHCRRGFFALKKQIPGLLDQLL